MKREENRLYFDYAAATPLREEALSAMLPFLKEHQGNPVSLHKEGVFAQAALEAARKSLARIINAHEDEIIFTSGGTEANGLALMGIFNSLRDQGRDPKTMHMVTSTIEHPSVLDTFHYFEKLGAAVTYVPVSPEGVIDIEVFSKSLRPETVLVSIMSVNNEIGTLQPIAEIGKVILKFRKEYNSETPFLHTDASQAALFVPLDVEKLHTDLLAVDSQKIYGPKGAGALFVRRGVPLSPLYFGGKQERGLRPGTQNVAGIVGMGKAFELALEERDAETKRLEELQNLFLKELRTHIPTAEINGSLSLRLPNNVNFSIPGFESTYLALQLDAKGVAVATRSACIRGGAESYVVAALGKGSKEASSSLRFSFGLGTRKEDITKAVEILKQIVVV